MDRDGIASGSWPFEPEGPEYREFLPSRLGRLQGERPGNGPVILATGKGAEEGCTLEDREIERLAAVPRDSMEPEAGEADIGDVGRHVQAAVIELGRVVADPAHGAVLNHVQIDRVGEHEPAMERLNGDAASLGAPDGRLKSLDGNVLLVVQVREWVRQIVRNLDEWLAGKLTSEFD